MSWKDASKLKFVADMSRFLRGDACRRSKTMTLMIYLAQLSSRAGGSTRVGVATDTRVGVVVDNCSREGWRPRPEGTAESGVVGLDPWAGLLVLELGLVSSTRGPQREAIARARTLRRKS